MTVREAQSSDPWHEVTSDMRDGLVGHVNKPRGLQKCDRRGIHLRQWPRLDTQNRGLGCGHPLAKTKVKLKDGKSGGIQIILAIKNLTGSPLPLKNERFLYDFLSLSIYFLEGYLSSEWQIQMGVLRQTERKPPSPSEFGNQRDQEWNTLTQTRSKCGKIKQDGQKHGFHLNGLLSTLHWNASTQAKLTRNKKLYVRLIAAP